MKKEEVNQFLKELWNAIEKELKQGVIYSQHAKEDKFYEMKRSLEIISDYVDMDSSRALEKVREYVVMGERSALERDDVFLDETQEMVKKKMIACHDEELDEEDIKRLSLQIQQIVRENLIFKESYHINVSRRRGNDFFYTFEEEIGKMIRAFGLNLQERDERMYEDIRNHLTNVKVNVEELTPLEDKCEIRILENLDLRMQEVVGAWIERARGKEEIKKEEMMKRYKRGFPLEIVGKQVFLIVSEPQIDENGNVVKKGERYTKAAFEDLFGDSEEKKDIMTLVGEYYDFTMTKEEWIWNITPESEKRLNQKEITDIEEKREVKGEPETKGQDEVAQPETIPVNQEAEKRKELFTEAERQQILLRIAKGELKLSQGLIPSYKIKESVINSETQEVEQQGLLLSEQAFVRYFSNPEKAALETQNYGHMLCVMSLEEKEKLEELEKRGIKIGEEIGKAGTPRKHQRNPNAYQKALEESGLDEIE